MKGFWQRFRKPLLIAIPALLLLGVVTVNMYERTSTNIFCGFNCHSMIPYYQSYFHSVHREANNVNCRDCHIPHDNILEAVIYKGYSGARDYYKTIFAPPDVIQVKDWSRSILQRNCIRCHQTVVSKINTEGITRCFECHRGIVHDTGTESFSSQNIFTPLR